MRPILLSLIALSCAGCSPAEAQAPYSPASHAASYDDTSDKMPPAHPDSMPPPHGKSLLLTASNSLVSLAGPPKGTADDAMKTGEFLIKSNGIKDVFENTTQGTTTTLRHRPSGLVCIGPQIVFVPKAQATSFDPGMQSGCLNWESGVQNSLTVISNSDSVPAAKALAALMAHEHTMFPTLDIQKTSVTGHGDHASGSMAGAVRNDPQYVHFAVASVNGWIVLEETRGSPDEAADCDRVAEADLNYAIASIHRPSRP
jgi:hypothetical protein